MSQIESVEAALLVEFPAPLGGRFLLSALGNTATTGWSKIALQPRFYVAPPGDGFWDFDFTGVAPAGIVLQVKCPVAAQTIFGAPDWFKGVRVHAASGSKEVTPSVIKGARLGVGQPEDIWKKTKLSNVIYRQQVASYDDSFAPIGMCSPWSAKMHKLNHTITLVVEGPDEAKIRHCVEQAAAAGLIAAIIAVFATGGGALSAATSAAIASLQSCLGSSYSVNFETDSHWIEWCT